MLLLFCFHKTYNKKVLFLFTDFEIYKIVNKTQLQNISWNDITNAIDINHTTTELAVTSEEYSICNTENTKILYLLRLLFNVCKVILQLGGALTEISNTKNTVLTEI